MTYLKLKGFFLMSLFTFPGISFAQYILNGSATQESCNCYVLTTEKESQAGSVWQATKIDLRQPFDFTFNVYLGCRDADGADGIVFILQPNSTSIGVVGQGLGFQGIVPSVGIPLDTWQNPGDPEYDNISIKINGDITHNNNLAGPVPASSTGSNIEDCQWHDLRIVWNPALDSLTTYFNGVFRLGAKIDLVGSVFNNDPMVYWGFTGATGGAFNVQKFCNIMRASFDTRLPQQALCLGETVQFENTSVHYLDIRSHYWDFGDGTTSTLAAPSHQYATPGRYQVTYKFTAIDGCESKPFIQEMVVGDIPKTSLNIYDTCESIAPRLEAETLSRTGIINQYQWKLDNQLFSTQKHPDFSALPPGNFSLSLQVTSEYGCRSNVAGANFTIKPKPHISFDTPDGCKDVPLTFIGIHHSGTAVENWKWHFEKDEFYNDVSLSYTFSEKGTFPVSLVATGTNGCMDEFVREIFINAPDVQISKDTIVVPEMSFPLQARGGVSYSWSPATGLSNAYIANPMATATDDIRYRVTVSTEEGCTDTASVMISVFKGSAVYVPNAFTPNGDGVNDLIRPYLVGIRSLSYFTVYDRWGNKVFSTSDMGHGWDGMYGGKRSTGAYVWIIKAEDILGKVYVLKGNFMLLQ